MGIHDPNIAFVPVYGVFQLFYCKMGPKETMSCHDELDVMGHGVVMSLLYCKRVSNV